jgi:hypothetical protein
MYKSLKTEGLFCFSPGAKGEGLPQTLAPWEALGVLRPDQTPPHGMSRDAIMSGVKANGYQLWRNNQKTKLDSAKKN